MDLELHLPTLFAISMAVNFIVGLCFYVIFRSKGGSEALKMLALACGCFFVGACLSVAQEVFEFGLSVSNAGAFCLTLSAMLTLLAIRFYVCQDKIGAVTMRSLRPLIYVMLGFIVLSAINADRYVISSLMSLIMAYHFAQSARVLGLSNTPYQSIVRLVQGVFGLHGLVMLVYASKLFLTAAGWQASANFEDMALASHVVLTIVASIGVPTMMILSKLDRVTHLAQTDDLTGALNRQAFKQKSAELIKHSVLHNRVVSLFVLDIDHFKQVNDTHGHLNGDKAIRKIAQIIKTNLRVDDVIGRIGGEEFAIVLSRTSPDEAIKVGHRLISQVQAQGVYVDDLKLKLTISVGTVIHNSEVDDIDQLINAADKAMYSAKSKGRNRMEIGQLAY